MRIVIAIAFMLAFSASQAAQTYFGVYGISESDSIQSCSGNCPASTEDSTPDGGVTVGIMSGHRVKFGGEAMLSAEPAALLKVSYSGGPVGIEAGAGVQWQKANIAVTSGGNKSLYAAYRDAGPIASVGVTYRHFAITYMTSEATHDVNSPSFSVASPVGPVVNSSVKVRKQYVRIEYRIDF